MGLAAGMRLGPYEIVAPLGAGGMGEVYRARDTRLGRDVAVKVLPEDVAGDARALARFETEARAVAALSHPNILALHDVGKEGTVSFVVMELLEGETLREALAKGPLPLRKALDVGLQVAEGLAAAHGKGIVHRDVKPENVFLTKDGHAKLLDFGLARHDVTRHDPADTRSPTLAAVSEKGVVLGTVAYMSPEQARGETVDFRSDQFSLGTVLYEMLTGKRPFVRDTAAETMTAIIREEPEPVTKLDPKLPALLGWTVQRCLSKDSRERYSSTEDLAKELQNLRTHLSEAVSATDLSPGGTPRLRRRVPIWALAAVAALAVVVGLLLGSRFLRSGSPPASPLVVSLSFPVDAAPLTENHNPLALSPDGKTLVYSGSKGDNWMLFVRRLDRSENREIPGTDGAWLPFISPDGLEVGFFAGGKLKKVSLAGGSPITLCDAQNPRGGSWGPDGTIVFTPKGPSGLWRIPASGGEPRQVTTPDATKFERHTFPQILPDGDHVLFFMVDRTGNGRVAVVSLRTGEQKILVEDAEYPRYLPTGHLLFTRPGSLFAVAFNPKLLKTSGPPFLLLDDLATNFNWIGCSEYAFSQGGTLVYVPSPQLQRTLVWVDRKGAVERVPFPAGAYEEVALSPDGGRFAATTSGKGETFPLLIGDFTRGTLSSSTVALAEGTIVHPVWAPDGRRVAISFGPRRKPSGLYWLSADLSTPPERLTSESDQQESPSSFSPDGSLLVFHAHDYVQQKSKWFVLPLNGEKTPHPFLPHDPRPYKGNPQFSPDGRWVSYEAGQVFVQPYPGPGGMWQISTEGGGGARWSRSGRELFYRNGDKMMAVDIETKPTFRAGRPRTLFEGHFLDGYDVAPDGKRFLMIKEDPAELAPAHVNVLLNWFEEVKRRVPGAK